MKKQKILIFFLTIILILTQTSCMDLVGLRKFTEETVKAGSKFKAISQDPYRNCAIRKYYQKTKNDKFKTIMVFNSPDEYLKTVSAADRKDCEDRKAKWKNFQEANKILVTYFYVMGTLAADDIANTDDEFGAIKGHVATLSGSDPFYAAVLGVANTITNILADAKRRKGIKRAILDSNGSVTAVTTGLSNALDEYTTGLEREREELILMYQEALNTSKVFDREKCCQNRADNCRTEGGANNPNVCVFEFTDALAMLTSRNTVEAEVQQINTKITAARAYQKVLLGVRNGHNELFQEAQKGFDTKQAVRIALKYAPAIQTNFDELSAAF
jgi:hypothetical protein